MKIYTFSNGEKCISNLSADELIKRMKRLDCLRVMTEGYEEGEGFNICQKAWKAYNKLDNFTGIIRLSAIEKDFLSYLLESEMISESERKVIEYYTR